MNFNFPLCRILHVVGGDLQDVVTGTAEAPNVFGFQLRLTIKTPKEDSCPPIKLDGGGVLKRATFLNLIQRLPAKSHRKTIKPEIFSVSVCEC